MKLQSHYPPKEGEHLAPHYPKENRQPVVTALTVIGTALAIFLIMAVVMVQQISTIDIPPESNRSRSLHARFICISNSYGGQTSNSLSLYAIRQLFAGLPHTQALGIHAHAEEAEAAVPGRAPLMAVSKAVNDDFFRICSYQFVDGAPFTASDIESSQPVAVVSQSVARALYGRADVAGQNIIINRTPFRIAGVIGDVNPITPLAYSEIFVPIPSTTHDLADASDANGDKRDLYAGEYQALILAENAKYLPDIKAEAKGRYAKANNLLKDEGYSISYFGAPFTQEESIEEKYSNVAPDLQGAKRAKFFLYAVLLLVPAINLSSLTHIRLRQRVTEIGIKRAFGCSRARIMGEMIVENLVLTLAGAAIGLALSIIMAWLFADFLFVEKGFDYIAQSKAAFSPFTMLSWTTFGWALFFCFLLNILSCGVPVWLASRVNPAEAINGHTA